VHAKIALDQIFSGDESVLLQNAYRPLLETAMQWLILFIFELLRNYFLSQPQQLIVEAMFLVGHIYWCFEADELRENATS
jgi:hypothetical protein